MNWDYFPRKPSVASQRAAAEKKARSLKKKDKRVEPVVIEGRKIVQTFWGKAWCKNLESYHDFANRLPRGRSYVLNRAVVDLRIGSGDIQAKLMGSDLYQINISIEPLPEPQWDAFKQDTSGQISSAIALLKGELPNDVLKRIVDLKSGLFPAPREITMHCNCPDSARMCKHIAAAMYGVGHRLDAQPELLFMLRGVDHAELLQQVISSGGDRDTANNKPQVADKHLEGIFGVKIVRVATGFDELLKTAGSAKRLKTKAKKKAKTIRKKIVKKKTKKAAKGVSGKRTDVAGTKRKKRRL